MRNVPGRHDLLEFSSAWIMLYPGFRETEVERMELPDTKFYLFGMGKRRKLVYMGGALKDAFSGEVIRQWESASERIAPEEYTVEVTTKQGATAAICEDETGVFVSEGGTRTYITESPVRLPRFETSPHAKFLRALHQEVLINVVDGKPVPNLFVYKKPWYRDAAMMAIVLSFTGNIALIADWIRSIDEPFDRNNGGECEPDNLGQALYMVSLVSNTTHPVVDKVLEAAEKRREGRHITGKTDGQERPVYQTKWLKMGLRSIGLPDPYVIPEAKDVYSALFWMDYKERHVETERFSKRSGELYPYLAWAEAHFYGQASGDLPLGKSYPLTWEAEASQADYKAMAVIGEEWVERKIAGPHGWHAAEAFLYYLHK